MADQDARDRLTEALIRADISPADHSAFRLALAETMSSWERRGNQVRRAAWIAGSLLIISMASPLVIESNPNWREVQLVRVLWGAAVWSSLLVTAGCLIWYRSKYSPTIRAMQFEVQMAAIRELQQEVADLRRRLDSKA